MGRRQAGVLRPTGVRGSLPGHPLGVLDQREDLPDRGGVHPRVRARDRRSPGSSRAGVLPDPRACGRLRRPLPRRPDDPGHLHPRVRHSRARAARGADRPALLGRRLPRSRVLGVRVRGLPGGHRVRAPEPSGCRQIARADARTGASLRRHPAGRASCDPAAPERLHRPPEGHGARGASRRRRGVSAVADRGRRVLQLHARTSRRRSSSSRSRSRWRASPTGSSRATSDGSRPGGSCERQRARDGGRAEVVRQARGAARHRPRARRARGGLPHRRVRLREVDAPALREPARADRLADGSSCAARRSRRAVST